MNFTSSENRKNEIKLNRIRKMISLESVNADSEFFICLTLVTRRKTSFSRIKLFPNRS